MIAQHTFLQVELYFVDMLLLLNWHYNKNKEMIKVPRKRPKNERIQEVQNESSVTLNGNSRTGREINEQEKRRVRGQKRKSKKKDYIMRPKLWKDLPIEKKYEAIVIVSIGFLVPLLYGLYNFLSYGINAALYPPIIEYNLTVQPHSLDPTKILHKYDFLAAKTQPQSTSSKCDLNSIERMSRLSLHTYYRVFDAKWPVIITDCVTQWKAMNQWNVQYFLKNYGKQRVTMSAASKGTLESAESFALPLETFLKHLYDASEKAWTYLQDELFLPKKPELVEQLGTCAVQNEDFFMHFPKEARPWWAFFLWGTKYSRSQLHMDPYNWTGTNAIIRGKKRWKLYPPGQDKLMYVKESVGKFPLRSRKYNSHVDAFSQESVRRHPLIQHAKCIEFVQNPGELLVIPTGWFHQAYNEEATLAVAGQLMNRGNYKIVLEELYKAGDLDRHKYRHDLLKLTPSEQVVESVKRLSPEVKAAAKKITDITTEQVEKIDTYKHEL